MNPTLQALLDLQDTDREIYRVRAELERLPRELSSRGEKLTGLRERIAELNKDAQDLRIRVKEVEDTVANLRARQRKLEAESNEPGVDAALLASYQHEIRTVKGTINEAEEDGLRLLSLADGKIEEAAQHEATLEEELPDFTKFEEAVATETAAAEARLAKLEEERKGLESEGIPEEQLTLYLGLLERREGEALAEVALRYHWYFPALVLPMASRKRLTSQLPKTRYSNPSILTDVANGWLNRLFRTLAELMHCHM